MVTTKEQERKAKPLADIVRENFKGPFLLQCIRGNIQVYPEATRFRPTDDAIYQKAEIEGNPAMFSVAAWTPKLGVQYQCLVRQRFEGGIVEVLPINFGHGLDWRPQVVRSDFEVVFHQDEKGRWSARHPRTGQIILKHMEFELPAPGKDGTVVFRPGELELRPTATRTFWIAGAAGTLTKVSDHALEIYGGNGEIDYSFAAQFRLLGKWFTAFEVAGNPFAGVVETTDSFTMKTIQEEVEKKRAEVERWAQRELLPVLHPDRLSGRTDSTVNLDKLLIMADESRNGIMDLISWFEGWANFVLTDIRQRKIDGLKPRLRIPEPFGRKTRKGSLLIEKNSDELWAMMIQKPRPKKTEDEAIPKPETGTATAKMTAKPATSKKPAAAGPKPKKSKLHPTSEHSELPLAEANPEAAATLAALKEEIENGSKGRKVSKKKVK